METLKFTVRLRELRALRLFASEDESRFALNGVKIEVEPKKSPILIATDGRRFLGYRSECEPSGMAGEAIIHRNFIDRLVAFVKGDKLSLGDEFEISVTGQKVTATSAGYNLSVSANEAIDTAFPNWKQVIPNASDPPQAVDWLGLNGPYLASFPQAAELLGATSLGLKLRLHGKESPVEITCDKLPQFFGVVMPIKMDTNLFERPEWTT